MKSKVLVIGVDGATFDVISPLVKQGKLPTIGKLMKEGCHGVLESTMPFLTPPAWTSMVTGVNPGKHGVYDFWEPIGNLDKPSFTVANPKKSKIWQHLTKKKKKMIIQDLPLQRAEEINGIIIIGPAVQKNKPLAYPKEMEKEIKKVVGEEVIRGLSPAKAIPIKKRVALEEKRMDQKEKIALYFKNKYPWDLCFIVFNLVDMRQHRFWNKIDKRFFPHDKKIKENLVYKAYERIDKTIAKLTKGLEEDTSVILVSDHGFESLKKVVFLNKFLEERGYLKRKKKEASKDTLFQNSFINLLIKLDVLKLRYKAPHNLTRKILETLYGRNISVRFTLERNLARINFEETIAFATSGSVNGIYINTKKVGSNKYEEIREKIMKELKELNDSCKEPIIKEIYKKEEIYNGLYIDTAPDIVIYPKNTIFSAAFGIKGGEEVISDQIPSSGTHDINGIFVAWGKNIESKEIKGAKIIDVMPTILQAMKLPIPEDVEGKVLPIFTKEYTNKNPPKYEKREEKYKRKEYKYTEKEKEEIRKRLEDIGYLS